MSYADYLWTVAKCLRTDVRGEVASEQGQETLQNCVRVLTAIANALEASAATPPTGALPPLTDARTHKGPPENSALYGATEAFVAQTAQQIKNGELAAAAVRSLATWENNVIVAAVERMDEIEAAQPLLEQNPALIIDRDRLEAYLRKASGEAELRIVKFRMAMGGRSRQTALFEVEGAPSLPSRMVVQRGLPGMATSFAGPAVEFQVISRMHAAGVKAARPVLVETAEDALGAAFMVIGQMPGKIVEGDYWAANAPLPIARELAGQMAKVHAQPIGDLGAILPDPRPNPSRQAWADELDRFEAIWRAKNNGASISMESAIAWLRANIDCIQDRRCIVHNDMVFHNILAENGEISAVLDWEQTAIGHPGEDLGYCYPVVSRVMPWQDYMAAYRAAGGADISDREVDYFSLRALVRLTSLVFHGREAFEGGHTRDIVVAGAGAFFMQRLLRRLSDVLVDVLERDKTRNA
ncbi:MAG: phosphotransferase family protein [Caulobacterales bacterium]